MGLMLSVLVMCVGVLEAISSVQHIRESFLPLDTTRKKRRLVVDVGTGTIRHADIGWPGDVPKGLHVIKKRSGLSSPHSSFDVPDDDHVSRRCSEHFDSAQLERAVSAILIEEDISSDETSEEVTQILSGVVQSCIEFPTEHSRVPQRFNSPPEPCSHDTFAPINEPRQDAERVPEKQLLLASEAVEADLVDLKPAERLIKYSSVETGLDEYDSSESSEKYSREKRSVSKSETSVSYGSELPSSSLSSEILADEEHKSKPLEVLSVCKEADIPVNDRKILVEDDTDDSSDLIDSDNNVLLPGNAINLFPQPQLSVPETTQHQIHPETHRSLSEIQVPSSVHNDGDPSKLNEPETFTHPETIVELIESTNNIVFSDGTRPTLQHSESIVELIQSTNSLVFVPETKSQENGVVNAPPVERQESIEELIKSTNNVILCRELSNSHQDLSSTNDTSEGNSDGMIESIEKDSSEKDDVLSEFPEHCTAAGAEQDDKQFYELRATETEVVVAHGNNRSDITHRSTDETALPAALSGNSFDEKLRDVLSEVEEHNIESIGTSEQLSTSAITSLPQSDSVPVVRETETDSPVQKTRMVKVSDASQEVMETPLTKCLSALDSPAEIEMDINKSHPILTSSSSEEDDSVNSVTTIITECVQTVVDIGPTPKKRDAGDQLDSSDEVNEIPCSVPVNQIRDIDIIAAFSPKGDELEPLEEFAVDYELGNHGLCTNTEGETTRGTLSGGSVMLTGTDDVMDAASSPESRDVNRESRIFIPELLTSTLTDESIVDTSLEVVMHDSGAGALDQEPAISKELILPDQLKGVIVTNELESAKERLILDSSEVDTGNTWQKPFNNKTTEKNDLCNQENIRSSNEGGSLLKSIVSDNIQEEIVLNTCSRSEKSTCSQNDAIIALDETPVSGDQDRPISASLKSDNNAVAIVSVEYDTHRLAEIATDSQLVESASVSDRGGEIDGETIVVNKEVQNDNSAELSRVDPKNEITHNPQLIDYVGLDNSTDSVTATETELVSASIMDGDESEVHEREQIISEKPQSSKPQNLDLDDTREHENDSTGNDNNYSTQRTTGNELSSSTSVMDCDKYEITNSPSRANSSDEREVKPTRDAGPKVPWKLGSQVDEALDQELVGSLKSPTDTESASMADCGKPVAGEKRVDNAIVITRQGDLKMDTQVRDFQISDNPVRKLVGPNEATNTLVSVPIHSAENVHQTDKTRKTPGDDRTTESTTDSRKSASEVQQEIRRVSSIDEGDVINVTPCQNRSADMENVQEAPSTSPDKAFWVRD